MEKNHNLDAGAKLLFLDHVIAACIMLLSRQKTNNLHMLKQRCRSAVHLGFYYTDCIIPLLLKSVTAQLILLVFTTQIV